MAHNTPVEATTVPDGAAVGHPFWPSPWEPRSSPQGHPAYRRVALEMHRLIREQAGHHAIADAMSHITTEAPELERLEAERRAELRRGH